jgi:predicted Zn-dependent protease with MMP-like domain
VSSLATATSLLYNDERDPTTETPVMKSLSLKAFCREVRRVMETLPAEFYPYLENVVVDVEDYPDEKTLRGLEFSEDEIREGESLYGLFIPMGLTVAGGNPMDEVDQPHRIVIYRKPLEQDFPERAELREQIRKTVIHELAHHFGYTDEDLEKWTDVY